MKLIIDIDEQHFELLQMAVMNGMGDNAQKIIAQGIPLEQIRDEIEKSKVHEELGDVFKAHNVAIDGVLQIIDKYR